MSNADSHANAELIDARGLLCPEPILHLRATIKTMAQGQIVQLLTTDPLAQVDVAAFCLRGGHNLLECKSEAGFDRFSVQRGA